MRFVAECLTEAGFDVHYEPRDGGMSADADTDAEWADLERQKRLCSLQYPVDERYMQPLTRSQQEFIYTWYVTESMPCLVSAGITVEEPPSLEAWIESAEAGPAWAPWSSVLISALEEEERLDLIERCPQVLPSDVLYSK